jgi:hypothetical protein
MIAEKVPKHRDPDDNKTFKINLFIVYMSDRLVLYLRRYAKRTE